MRTFGVLRAARAAARQAIDPAQSQAGAGRSRWAAMIPSIQATARWISMAWPSAMGEGDALCRCTVAPPKRVRFHSL
jgi:hypothetical protein